MSWRFGLSKNLIVGLCAFHERTQIIQWSCHELSAQNVGFEFFMFL